MRTALAALLILSAAGAARAEGESKDNPPAPIRQPRPPQMLTPGSPEETIVVGGGRDQSGPGATGTVAHSGTGADTVIIDSAKGGNAEQPSRALPLEGGGGK